MRSYEAPDGVHWGVEIRAPGASNVMVVFHYPDGRSSRLNRYAWYVWAGAEARDVTARLKPAQVLDHLEDADLARLFRRSMPVSAEVPTINVASAGTGA
jgi:hypothetical protein